MHVVEVGNLEDSLDHSPQIAGLLVGMDVTVTLSSPPSGIEGLQEEEDIEEERRLCYVGMTRAKRKLYMTHAICRRVYGRLWRERHSPWSACRNGEVLRWCRRQIAGTSRRDFRQGSAPIPKGLQRPRRCRRLPEFPGLSRNGLR